MKILAINNYSIDDCMKKSSNYEMPKHHNWCCDKLVERGDDVETALYMGDDLNGKLRKAIHAITFTGNILRRSRDKDIIISFCAKALDIVAFLKSIGVVDKKKKIICLIHHYSRSTKLSDGYDRVLFLSNEIMALYKKKYPKIQDRMKYVHWGPDLGWYDRFWDYRVQNECGFKCDAFSNGKSSRDISLIYEAAKKLGKRFCFFGKDGITNAEECTQRDFVGFQIKTSSAIDTTDLLFHSQVCCIPIRRTGNRKHSVIICGLTSVLDALALGKPIIISDNAHLGIDFEGKNLGVVYTSGQLDDFIGKYKRLLDKDMIQIGLNGRKYAQDSRNYDIFCKEVTDSIDSCVAER